MAATRKEGGYSKAKLVLAACWGPGKQGGARQVGGGGEGMAATVVVLLAVILLFTSSGQN